MITMQISYTARSPHPASEWTRFHEKTENFEDMEAVRTFLEDEYYYCKTRKPCYCDTLSRGAIQNGWIYCFKAKEDGKTHYEQHWVALYDTTNMAIDVQE